MVTCYIIHVVTKNELQVRLHVTCGYMLHGVTRNELQVWLLYMYI